MTLLIEYVTPVAPAAVVDNDTADTPLNARAPVNEYDGLVAAVSELLDTVIVLDPTPGFVTFLIVNDSESPALTVPEIP